MVLSLLGFPAHQGKTIKKLLSLHIGKVKTNGKTIVSNASIGELKQGTPL